MPAGVFSAISHNIRARPRLSEVYYGWWIVAAATLALGVGGGLSFWTFTVYITPLENDFGWSRAEVSGAVSAAFLVSGLAGPFIGSWIDRHGSRSAILIGSVLTGACYMLLASIGALWHLYALHVAASFFRSWAFYIPFQALVARWFSRRRGTAIAIASSGFSLGGIVFVPLIAFLVNNLGWRQSYFLSGVMLIAVFVPITLFVLRNSPADKGLTVENALPDEAPAQPRAHQLNVPSVDWRLADVLRTPSFWLLSFAFMTFFIGQISFMVHAVPFFESRGLSSASAAALISYSAIVTLGARIAFGFLADRVSEIRLLASGTAILLAVGLAIALGPTSPLVLALFVLLWGVASGGGPVLESLLITRAFGIGSFAALLGTLMAVETAGMIAGPVLGGYIFDVSGSYTLAFLVYIIGFAFSAVAFVFFRPPTVKRASSEASGASAATPSALSG